MCEPSTIAYVAVTLIGAAVAITGQNAQAEQAEAYADYQHEQNVADADAEAAAGRVEAERIRKLGKRTAAEAEATFAGAGIDVTEGTAVDVNREIIAGAEEDAFFAITGGKDRAARLRAQGEGALIEGRNARNGARWNNMNTVLQTGSTLASGWKSGDLYFGKQPGKG